MRRSTNASNVSGEFGRREDSIGRRDDSIERREDSIERREDSIERKADVTGRGEDTTTRKGKSSKRNGEPEKRTNDSIETPDKVGHSRPPSTVPAVRNAEESFLNTSNGEEALKQRFIQIDITPKSTLLDNPVSIVDYEPRISTAPEESVRTSVIRNRMVQNGETKPIRVAPKEEEQSEDEIELRDREGKGQTIPTPKRTFQSGGGKDKPKIILPDKLASESTSSLEEVHDPIVGSTEETPSFYDQLNLRFSRNDAPTDKPAIKSRATTQEKPGSRQKPEKPSSKQKPERPTHNPKRNRLQAQISKNNFVDGDVRESRNTTLSSQGSEIPIVDAPNKGGPASKISIKARGGDRELSLESSLQRKKNGEKEIGGGWIRKGSPDVVMNSTDYPRKYSPESRDTGYRVGSEMIKPPKFSNSPDRDEKYARRKTPESVEIKGQRRNYGGNEISLRLQSVGISYDMDDRVITGMSSKDDPHPLFENVNHVVQINDTGETQPDELIDNKLVNGRF